MAPSSIDGLVTGLNTTQIISQLMAVERLPERQLTDKKSSTESMVRVLQGLNSMFAKLQTVATALVPDSITGASAFTAKLATTSDATIATATAGSKALAGGISFSVTGVATAGAAVTSGTVASTATAVAGGPFTLTKGGAATTINVASGATLAEVVTAINGSAAGVTAAAVQVSPGAFRLQLTSQTTGSGSDVSIAAGSFASSTLGDTQSLTAGTDTVLHVGTGPGAYDVTSASTEVRNLLPDVTINVAKAAPGTQVSLAVTADTATMSKSAQDAVDAANTVLAEIAKQSSYNSDAKIAGPLLGNSFVRGLRDRIADAVIGGAGGAPSDTGISVLRDGTVAFDKTKFLALYAKDPAAAQATLVALGRQLTSIAKQASDPGTGQITKQIALDKSDITDTTKQIASFEDRMTLRQQTLQRQYASLEVALGKLKSQSAWLTGQLASLPTNASSN